MTTDNESKVTIRLPHNEFPYNDCVVEEGDPANLSEKLVFTTIGRKSNIKRRITIHPNGTIIEQVLTNEASVE